MKMDIVKTSSRNIAVETILKTYRMIGPFIFRTLIISYLGIEYAGLGGLFTSLLNVLNLAELGVGSAMLYSMYEPIAQNNTSKICAIMNLYKRYYRYIGFVVLVLGLIFVPFLKNMIAGGIPSGMNIYILYLMNLLTTVFSYWLFSYKNCLLVAFQRNDIIHTTQIFVMTVQYGAQLFVLIYLHNYYIYLGVALITTIAFNLIKALIVNKRYPQYSAKGELPQEEKHELRKNISALFLSKLGGVVVNSADTIVISGFLGLAILGTYQNYYTLMTTIVSFVAIFFNSCRAGLGNQFAVDGKTHLFTSFQGLNLMIAWICGFCTSCFLVLFQPFIQLWLGKAFLLQYGIVILLCIYFYVLIFMALGGLYEDAAGVWHYDRYRPLCEAFLNLGLNLVLVHFIGLYGILLSTIISMLFFSFPWLLYNLFRNVFQQNLLPYIKKISIYTLVVLGVNAIIFWLSTFAPSQGVIALFVRLCICLVVSNGVFLLTFGRTKEFQWIINVVKRIHIPFLSR